MAGLEADVSSYNQPLPVAPLDNAIKYGEAAQRAALMPGQLQQQQQQIQSNAIGIDKDKLNLMSQQFGIINNELANLIDSNATKPQAAERLDRIAKTLNLPEPVKAHMMEELNQAPDVNTFAKFAIRRGMETMQKYGVQLGTNETQEDNKYKYSGVRASPEHGGGFRPTTKLPIQIAPGTPGYNQQNQQVFEQPAGPPGVAPAVPIPRPRLGLPAERPTTGATGASVPLTAGPTPMFEEGKKAYAADQELATQKLTAIKPALLALDMIPGLRSGPTTNLWNESVAALKANNIISTDTKNDPTAIYQQVNKYLNDYLSRRGGSTDAAREQIMKSSPDLGTQINPALLKLTQTAVAQDRIEAARYTQFKKDGQSRQDFQNYGSHRAGFPAGMDERAFIADKMTHEQKQDLAKELLDLKSTKPKLENGKPNPDYASNMNKYDRFVRSLKAFEDSKVGGQNE